MPRKLLDTDEILQVDAALIKAFALHTTFQKTVSGARHINFPQIPQGFSESIVAASSPKLFENVDEVTPGKSADLLLIRRGAAPLNVEVKATARCAFQEIKQKDLKADYLVSVRYF